MPFAVFSAFKSVGTAIQVSAGNGSVLTLNNTLISFEVFPPSHTGVT